MHIRITDAVPTSERDELAAIVRACVHCGFCNATCPTYLELGDELDGPRGRIYLMKQALAGQPVSRITQQHLDRCLNCRACETTCPSGVRYGRLLDATRPIVDANVGRGWANRWLRRALTALFPYRRRFAVLLSIARRIKPLLPAALATQIPPRPRFGAWPAAVHRRKMLVLTGCVQNVLAPDIDRACAVVLHRLGISLLQVVGSGCCGALSYHLAEQQQAVMLARRNIDACWPLIEQGAEAIVMTSSGCGVMAQDYGELLRDDAIYADKAARFAALVKDPSTVLHGEDLRAFRADGRTVAFQAPCTLQHGQQQAGAVESLLRSVGYDVVSVADAHLCCGSAGVYSLLQPKLAQRLRDRKRQALLACRPDVIATANIGCLQHLQSADGPKVLHWLQLLVNE